VFAIIHWTHSSPLPPLQHLQPPSQPPPRTTTPRLRLPPFTRLTTEQRWTCVVLHKQGWTKRRTADVHSGSRSGRPRCTDEQSDTNMTVVARIDKFTSPPRQIRRKLELECCARTVDRRLIEVGLFGRVA
jgi:hypothetical protein